MASKRAKIIGMLVLLGIVAGAGAAKAAGDDDDDDDVPPPPPEDEPADEPDDVPDVNFPPLGNLCNFSGCGAQFDNTHLAPASYCIRVQQLGYPIDCALVASNGSYIAVNPQRAWVYKLQLDHNKLRNGAGLAAIVALKGAAAQQAFNAIKQGGAVTPDGLIGNQTIAMMDRAFALQLATGIAWRQMVAIS